MCSVMVSQIVVGHAKRRMISFCHMTSLVHISETGAELLSLPDKFICCNACLGPNCTNRSRIKGSKWLVLAKQKETRGLDWVDFKLGEAVIGIFNAAQIIVFDPIRPQQQILAIRFYLDFICCFQPDVRVTQSVRAPARNPCATNKNQFLVCISAWAGQR